MNFHELFYEGFLVPEPLSKEKINELLLQAKNGSKYARDLLIIHNIKLVLFELSKTFKSVEYDKNDLLSLGCLGLIKAIDTYDIDKGYEFNTYAIRCIDNEINMFLRKLVRIQRIDSLDRPIYIDSNGNELNLKETINSDACLEDDIIDKDIIRIVRELVEKLGDREKKIIMLYFGFYDNKTYSQKEISSILNISQSYVSKLVNVTINNIKNSLIEMDIIEDSNRAL